MSPDPEPPPPALPVTEKPAAPPAPGSDQPVHTHCENCGTALAGPYCHRCGQHDFDLHRSIWPLFLEAVDTLFNIEGRFFRSLNTLMFRPGRLTADFIAGKRVGQMPPFRLYIFVSFLFFVVIFLNDSDDQFVREAKNPHQGITLNGQPVLTFGGGKDPSGAAAAPAATPPAATDAKPRLVDQLRATADEAKAAAEKRNKGRATPALARELNDKAVRLNDPSFRRELSERIETHLPHMLMVCLPLFALYTRVLFRKSGLPYLQHLVLALHFHTFIFLWVLFCKGWSELAGLPGWNFDGRLALYGNLWLWIYPVVMLRRLFANSWVLTGLKTLLLFLGYTLTIGLGFMGVAVIALLFA